MIRRAFTLRLEPGALAQYKEHHDNIWPELVAEIEKAGIGQMTAFVSGNTVFYYSEVRDEGAWDRLWHTEVHDRWGELFKALMAFNDEGIVDTSDLTEIFHLETGAA